MKLYHDNNNPFCKNEYTSHNMFVDFDKEKWILTDNIKEADVIPAIFYRGDDYSFIEEILHPDQVLMVVVLFSNDNFMNPEWFRGEVSNHFNRYHKKTIVVHTNLNDSDDPTYVPFDIMFNRQKMFCTDIKRTERGHSTVWMSLMNEKMYELSTIDKQYDSDNKHFLCPNRIFPPGTSGYTSLQQVYRRALSDIINNIGAKSYLSDPFNGKYFKPNYWDDSYDIKTTGGTWYPIADSYYNTSYISVFIESVISEEVMGPSEKTFDPLIKGNFPMIFSSPGTIEFCKNYYGFKFPNWIDYSYDTIQDNDDRFAAFLSSIKTVAEIPINELHTLYNKDRDILDHNRQVFFDRPYDSLFDKIKTSIKSLGW